MARLMQFMDRSLVDNLSEVQARDLTYSVYGMAVQHGLDPDNLTEEQKKRIGEALKPTAEELARGGGASS